LAKGGIALLSYSTSGSTRRVVAPGGCIWDSILRGRGGRRWSKMVSHKALYRETVETSNLVKIALEYRTIAEQI